MKKKTLNKTSDFQNLKSLNVKIRNQRKDQTFKLSFKAKNKLQDLKTSYKRCEKDLNEKTDQIIDQ